MSGRGVSLKVVVKSGVVRVRCDLLQAYDDPYWVTKHRHGNLLGVGRERRTEDSLLYFRMRTRCDDFLHLLQELSVEHAVCLIENDMPDTAHAT